MSTVLAFKLPKRNSPSIENGIVAPPRRIINLQLSIREHLAPTADKRQVWDLRRSIDSSGRDRVRVATPGPDPINWTLLLRSRLPEAGRA